MSAAATEPPTPRILTVAEAATALHMSERGVYEAIKRGDIPAIRVGSRWKIPAAPFEAKFGPHTTTDPVREQAINTLRNADTELAQMQAQLAAIRSQVTDALTAAQHP